MFAIDCQDETKYYCFVSAKRLQERPKMGMSRGLVLHIMTVIGAQCFKKAISLDKHCKEHAEFRLCRRLDNGISPSKSSSFDWYGR